MIYFGDCDGLWFHIESALVPGLWPWCLKYCFELQGQSDNGLNWTKFTPCSHIENVSGLKLMPKP